MGKLEAYRLVVSIWPYMTITLKHSHNFWDMSIN